MSAVSTSFISQQNTYIVQNQVVEMQQNARGAMDMLVRDIQAAGFDPNNLGAGITTVGIDALGVASVLTFTRDDGGGGLETRTYSLFDAYASINRNDGRADDLALQVTAADGGSAGRQPIAENMSQLEFRYLDRDGNTTNVLNSIRSVQIAFMVESAYPNTRTAPPQNVYTTPSGAMWNSRAGHRSIFLTTTVSCRNLGL